MIDSRLTDPDARRWKLRPHTPFDLFSSSVGHGLMPTRHWRTVGIDAIRRFSEMSLRACAMRQFAISAWLQRRPPSALCPYIDSSLRPECPNSSRSVTAQRTGEPDPKRKFPLRCSRRELVSITSPSCPKGAPAGYPPACSFTENGRAKKSVRDTGRGVIEGSTRCGFQNPSRFARMFRKFVRRQPLKISIRDKVT